MPVNGQETKTMKLPTRSLTALALAASMLVGCGGSKGGDISGIDPKVRFVNAFIGVPTIRASVGSRDISDSILYGTTSDYESSNNDTLDLSAGVLSSNDLATLSNRVFANNHRYTGIGYGPSGDRRVACLDNNREDAPSNNISLRVFNALTAPTLVDVYITSSSAGDSLPGSPSLASVVRGTASNYYSLNVGSGSTFNVRVRVYAAGDRSTALEDRTVNVTSRYRGTVIAMDPGADVNPLIVRDNA